MITLSQHEAFSPRLTSTSDLLTGLIQGFNIAGYELDAVQELAKRGERAKLMEYYTRADVRKTAKSAIRRVLSIK